MISYFTARKRSLRRLCFCTCLSVSHSVHRGVSVPQCSSPRQTRPGQTHPHPRAAPPPPRQIPPRSRHPSRSRHPPWEQTPPHQEQSSSLFSACWEIRATISHRLVTITQLFMDQSEVSTLLVVLINRPRSYLEHSTGLRTQCDSYTCRNLAGLHSLR